MEKNKPPKFIKQPQQHLSKEDVKKIIDLFIK